MSIGIRLTILLTIFAIIPATIFGVWTYLHARSSIEAVRLAQLNSIADLKKEKIELYFSERLSDLAVATRLPGVKRLLPVLAGLVERRDGDEYRAAAAEMDLRLKMLMNQYDYDDVVLTDPQGKVVYMANEAHASVHLGKPFEDRRLLESARNGPAFSDVQSYRVIGDQGIMFAASPVDGIEGGPAGFLIFFINLNQNNDVIQNTTGMGATAEVVIARKEMNEAFFLFPIRTDGGFAPAQSVKIGEQNGQPIQRAVQSENGSGVTPDYRGVEVMAAWRYIPSLRWGLVVKIDTSEAFAPIAGLRDLMLYIGVFLALAALLVSYLSARTVTRPVNELMKGTVIISEGNLDHDVATDSNDEIGQFSRAFSRMTRQLRQKMAELAVTAAELRQSRDLLDEKVMERTADLQKANRELADLNRAQKEAQQVLQRQAEMLRRTFEELEVRVEERTADLKATNDLLQQEIAERRKAEEKLATLVYDLENANRELGDFAYIVSHDLKAPLRGISSLAGMFDRDYRDRLDADGAANIDLLVNRVKRMYSLIDGILQYSRIGRVKEQRQDVDLNEVLSHVTEMLAPPPSIKVIVQNRLPVLNCDPTRIHQIFQNLIGNAIKFMDKREGEIRVGCTLLEGKYEFYVSDNGPGIDERHYDRIFKIFQTLQPRDELESTGIGLAIVKKIVLSYGGSIWLSSTIGSGTTFYFTLQGEARNA